jgi:Protein of unknown function (DUF2637)
VVSVALLAVIAAVVSFGHMRELALRRGEASWIATLIPLSVDGMVVAASMSVLSAGRMARRGEWLRAPGVESSGDPGRAPAGAGY